MKRNSVVIADYGIGNIGSIQKVLHLLEKRTVVSSDPEVLAGAHTVLLPGVGSAVGTIESVLFKRIKDSLRLRALAERPLVGLCLGAQLMFSYLHESHSVGLEIFRGTVRPIEQRVSNTGWRKIDFDALNSMGVASGLREYDHYFFNHGYEMEPSDVDIQICKTTDTLTPAIIRRASTWAIQFHPEKSQVAGVRLLRNVLNNG
jgi:glutamine amidotransferase